MALIFISYRRNDSLPRAARLQTDLAARFGSSNVFMDIDSIAFGDDFVARLERELEESKVAAAVIGPAWSQPGERSRLSDLDDFVRFEIRTALERGIPLIPVLVGGATMPPEPSLPADISGLTRKNAAALDDVRWRNDLVPLFDEIAAILLESTPLPEPPPPELSNWFLDRYRHRGFDRELGGALRILQAHLHGDEQVLVAVPAWQWYRHRLARRLGVLVGTDRRLIFVSKFFGDYFFELPYERLDTCEAEHRTDAVRLVVGMGTSNRFDLDGADAALAQAVIDAELDRRGRESPGRLTLGLHKSSSWPWSRWEWTAILRASEENAVDIVTTALKSAGCRSIQTKSNEITALVLNPVFGTPSVSARIYEREPLECVVHLVVGLKPGDSIPLHLRTEPLIRRVVREIISEVTSAGVVLEGSAAREARARGN